MFYDEDEVCEFCGGEDDPGGLGTVWNTNDYVAHTACAEANGCIDESYDISSGQEWL
jgi:hypothetical protein